MRFTKKSLAAGTLSAALALSVFAHSDAQALAAEVDDTIPVNEVLADTVTITFDPNGGTIAAGKETLEATTGTAISLPYTWQIGLANPGYSFIGWTVQETGETIGKYERYTPTQDVTLVAQWEVTNGKAQFYDHSFQITGVTLTAPDGTAYEMTSNSYTNRYRKWEAEDVPNGTYQVTFAGLAEGAVVDVEISNYHSSFVKISEGLEATFTFEDDKSTTFARAEFQVSYPVTFDAGNRGTIAEGETVLVRARGKVTEIPAVEAKKNFVLLGWSLDGETLIDPATVTVTEPIVFQAVYGKTNQGNDKVKLDVPGKPNEILNTEN